MIFPIIDADELYHSKGPWLTHKYIRREGKEAPFKYYYGEKTSTGKQIGEEKEVFLTERRKNLIGGGYNDHYVNDTTLDFRDGEYFEDSAGRRVAKVHPFSKYGLEFYDNPHKPTAEMTAPELIKHFRENGFGFISQKLKKFEPTYNYTNKAKGVDVTEGLSEYAMTPMRKRKPR